LQGATTENRVRAERRLGEMIDEQKRTVGLATGGQPYQHKSTGIPAEPVDRPTLAEVGHTITGGPWLQRHLRELRGRFLQSEVSICRNPGLPAIGMAPDGTDGCLCAR